MDVGGASRLCLRRVSGTRRSAELARLLDERLNAASPSSTSPMKCRGRPPRHPERTAAQVQAEAFDRLQEGVIVHGTVRSLTASARSWTLGGVDGLFARFRMSYSRGREALRSGEGGDQLELKVLKINRERQDRTGPEQLAPDPWSLVAEKIYSVPPSTAKWCASPTSVRLWTLEQVASRPDPRVGDVWTKRNV